MPLCMVISWVYSVAMMIQHIVAEKEHRLKEVGASAQPLRGRERWVGWILLPPGELPRFLRRRTWLGGGWTGRHLPSLPHHQPSSKGIGFSSGVGVGGLCPLLGFSTFSPFSGEDQAAPGIAGL